MIMSQTVVFPEAVPPETPAQHPLERVNDFNKSEKKKKSTNIEDTFQQTKNNAIFGGRETKGKESQNRMSATLRFLNT